MNRKIEIIKSDDGSHTLFLPELNETYHSTHGALQEGLHVFIKSGLEHFSNKEKIRVLEIGFGTGLNALLSCLWTNSNTTEIEYTSIEAYPVPNDTIKQLNYCKLIDDDGASQIFEDLHKAKWEQFEKVDDYFSLRKQQVKLEDSDFEQNHYDVVFFDAFAPSRQADMWTIDQLKKCSDALQLDGILVSYCANGQFKRNLKALGLELEMLPGPPGKREMTRAIKC